MLILQIKQKTNKSNGRLNMENESDHKLNLASNKTDTLTQRKR